LPHKGIAATSVSQTNAEPHRQLSLFFYFSIVLLGSLLIFSRRPDALMHPQFWAEDGAVWYADAYNVGWWKVLLLPCAGYIQLLPRACAALSLAFPLVWAPAVCNVVAILIHLLPMAFFMTRRFAPVASLTTRGLLSFLYLALPNSSELNGNITCAQWHLAILAFLVIIAEPMPTLPWRLFDAWVIVATALSGPFCIFLAPLAWIWWFRDRQHSQATIAAFLSLGAVVQGLLIVLAAGKGRSNEVLGASIGRLLKILAGKVFLASIIGAHDFGSMRAGWTRYLIVATICVVLAACVFVYGFFCGQLALKLFITFGLMVLAGALISPMASMNTPQWYVLQVSRSGLRYWFIPMLSFVTTLVWIAGRGSPRAVRIAAATILMIMPIGIIRDWRYPALANQHFEQYAASFERMPAGTELRIPINPSGWSMRLVKKAPGSR
jgi:hypothetical protein